MQDVQTLDPPFLDVPFLDQSVITTRRPDGSILARSSFDLGPIPNSISDWLVHWAQAAPDRMFLVQRDASRQWRGVTFGQAFARVLCLAQGLLGRGLGPNRPILILSDNTIEHGLLALAAMHIGVPVSPVSPAYALVAKDLSKIRHVARTLTPGMVFVSSGTQYERALSVPELQAADVVCVSDPIAREGCVLFDDLGRAPAGTDVADAHARVGGATIAKFLFTSGSTGAPKAVITTQAMMCANQEMKAMVWPFLSRRPPVLVDWLPWNHVFGGSHNFNMMLRNGGTIYIDDGKPLPGHIERSIANLREISPTISFNVPKAYGLLVPHLQQDKALREAFFGELDLIFYAGATLPENLWNALEDMAAEVRGARIPMVSSWGMTETAPASLMVHAVASKTGVVGVPLPGLDLKLVPDQDKMEIRVRGPNITVGYWRNEESTAALFDEEGFLRTGDAGRFVDPAHPSKGIVFDGRTSENFKLISGTWVHVGALRLSLVDAMAPFVQDVVITGHDRDEVGALVFLAEHPICTELGIDHGALSMAELAQRDDLKAILLRRLEQFAKQATGSSNRITRIMLMPDHPSFDANEITDKGYINQRAALRSRADEITRLYTDGDPDIIMIASRD